VSPKHTISSHTSTRGTIERGDSASDGSAGGAAGNAKSSGQPGYIGYDDVSHPPGLEVNPPVMDGSVPWALNTYRHPSGWVGTRSQGASDRQLSVTPTILGSYLPVVYGTAKVTGQCFLLKANPNDSWAILVVLFCHGEQQSLGSVEINGKTASEWMAEASAENPTDPWFSNYETFLGTDAGIPDPGAARTLLNSAGYFSTLRGVAGCIMRISLYSTSLPGSINITAVPTGKKITPLAGGAKTMSTNPIVIVKDILTDAEQWRGLSTGRFLLADWQWLEEMCDDDVMGDAVKRFSFNGALSMRNSVDALREVLAHCSCAIMHINGKFLPVPEWRPKPVSGSWAATASATLTGTGGAATTELVAGDRVYVDGDDGTLRTILSIGGNDSVTLTQTVTITANAYGNSVRPITSCDIEVEEWITDPEGADVPVGESPDVVNVTYHTIGTTDEQAYRAEDPDGYDAADVKRTELPLTGCTNAAMAARIGHIHRRLPELAPFSWTGTCAPTTDIVNLLPGDVFTFSTADGLTTQPAILISAEIKADGVYSLAFREYDFNCYVDDDADDDTPIDRGDAANMTPPDLPTDLDARFIREGAWYTRSKVKPEVRSIYGWTATNANLTFSGGSAALEHAIFAPTGGGDALLTSPEFELGLPRAGFLVVTFRLAMNVLPAPVATWYATPVAELEYWSGVASANTEQWSKDITIKQNVTNQYLCCFTVPTHATDTKHAFKVRISGDADQTYILSIWNFYVVSKGSIAGGAIALDVYNIVEHANADDTVSNYGLVAIDRRGVSQILATVERGLTSAKFYLFSGASSGHPLMAANFQNRYRFAAIGPGGTVRTDFDVTSGVDIKDRGVDEDGAEVILDYSAADWDDAAIAIGQLAAVSSDGVTKEYQTPGVVLSRALVTVTEKTGNHTLTATDFVILCDASGGSFTITLPAVASYVGKQYHVKKIDTTTNTVTVNANGTETIDGTLTLVLAARWDSAHIVGVDVTETDWAVI